MNSLKQETVSLDIPVDWGKSKFSAGANKIRLIERLDHVEFAKKAPFPKARARGSKGKGIAYEKQVLKPLQKFFGPDTKVRHNEWLAFEDDNGPGFALPDYFVLEPGLLWIFEVKYTHTLNAALQLQGLYGPLLTRLFPGRIVVKVEVCRNVTAGHPPVIYKLEEVFDREAALHVWHWRA